ncbi:DUF599 family protein [Oricola sp.]|uniref:DUF599 domain-containing protein n=1 Tax=Oricola sp. TaxID=1979950 RepID=UPI0025CEC837|nr:DUF599 family protein [Oricola sp.]MCI5074361.1 DUF599 family protein [Oricola sp.]
MESVLSIAGGRDLLALAFFAVAWLAFEVVVDRTPLNRKSLSGLMAIRRREWMLTLVERDLRMIDTAIVTGLQQGSAFFGSASILAIGGCFALFGSTDAVLQIFRDIPFIEPAPRGLFELKVFGLTTIFVYAFFKFGWAYRLFNYCSILIGGVRHTQDAPFEERKASALRAAEMNIVASRHFTAGMRAIFFGLAYLGWFLGPAALVFTTVFVIGVLARRQYFSRARQILIE